MTTATCSACGSQKAKISNGKNGTMSIACPDCGSLTMVKSPKAVSALRERMGGSGAPNEKKAAPAPGFFDDLKDVI